MGWGTGNLGGGSGGLNFKVVGYATEAELLADTPKENTIGVITSIPITGYHFGTEKPSPAAEGMVWITTGTSSKVEFNALKKDGIQVYPLSAKQMVSGVLKDVTAKSYQGGKWATWVPDGALFWAGVGQIAEFSASHETNATVSIGTDAIVATSNGTSFSQVIIQAPFNASGYNTLYVDAFIDSVNAAVKPGIAVNNTATTIFGYVDKYAAHKVFSADAKRTIYNLDISAFSGKQYFICTGGFELQIFNIWTE